MVQILLAAGADPTAQDAQHGRTALHTAAMANDVELVKVCKIAFVHDWRIFKHFLVVVYSSFICFFLSFQYIGNFYLTFEIHNIVNLS